MKKYSKYAVLSVTMLSVLFSAVIWLNPLKNKEKHDIIPVNINEPTVCAVEPLTPEHKYVAKIHGESLVIFATTNMNEPYYISDISLHTLTNSDFETLKDGIYLDTLEDISRLLEDFES